MNSTLSSKNLTWKKWFVENLKFVRISQIRIVTFVKRQIDKKLILIKFKGEIQQN